MCGAPKPSFASAASLLWAPHCCCWDLSTTGSEKKSGNGRSNKPDDFMSETTTDSGTEIIGRQRETAVLCYEAGYPRELREQEVAEFWRRRTVVESKNAEQSNANFTLP